MKLDVFSAPTTRNVTLLNRFSIENNYDWGEERAAQKTVLYVANQFIHAYASFASRGSDRNWSDFLVVSDFDRQNVIWRIQFATIVALFEATARDWPVDVQLAYDPRLKDYKVSTD